MFDPKVLLNGPLLRVESNFKIFASIKRMFDRPILVFSEYCIHSKNFLQILIKHPDLFQDFIRINVDVNPHTKQRSPVFYQLQEQLDRKIAKVPTIIVREETEKGMQVFVLSDKEAFKWLDFKTKPTREEGCVGFNHNEMGSFSDGYSKFGSTDLNDATEQNFKFFQRDLSGKNILKGENFKVSGDMASRNPDAFLEPSTQNDSSNAQVLYNNMEAERQQSRQGGESRQGVMGNRDLHSIPANSQGKVNSSDFNTRLNNYKQESGQLRGEQKRQIDFTNPNFGLAAKIGNVGGRDSGSIKEKELDMKLQQLLEDRNII